MEETIRVPETLRGAHPLVSQALHAFEQVERNENGILQKPKQGCLDVVVSRETARCTWRGLRAPRRPSPSHQVTGTPCSDQPRRPTPSGCRTSELRPRREPSRPDPKSRKRGLRFVPCLDSSLFCSWSVSLVSCCCYRLILTLTASLVLCYAKTLTRVTLWQQSACDLNAR